MPREPATLAVSEPLAPFAEKVQSTAMKSLMRPDDHGKPARMLDWEGIEHTRKAAGLVEEEGCGDKSGHVETTRRA